MSWRDIPGRCAYLWLYDEWIASNAREGAVIVEIGVALGKSLAYLCERLEVAGRDDVQVYAVDPWAGTHRNGEQTQWAEEVGGDFTLYAQWMMKCAPKAFERVRVVRLPDWKAHTIFPRLDLCVLDADHGYEAVNAELRDYRHAKWIGGDDFEAEYPGVERAVREAFGDDFEFRGQGGPIDNPTEYNWGTWLHRGKR